MKCAIVLLILLTGAVFGSYIQNDDENKILNETATNQVCIKERVVFTNNLTEIVQESGRTVMLTCSAHGNPDPRLTWIRNNEIISENENSSKFKFMDKYNQLGLESLLTILSLELDDSGIYTCQATQESADVSNCVHKDSINTILHVSYAPTFDDENKTRYIVSRSNQSIYLNCTAKAFPTPSYRWFINTKDVLIELQTENKVLRNETAVLQVFVNETTFGQTYLCHASNIYGGGDKFFKVLRTMKPEKPHLLLLYKSTASQIVFKIYWNTEILFIADEITVQYIKKASLPKQNRKPTESQWSSLSLVTHIVGNQEEDLTVKLLDLKEKTEYWVRVQIANEMGVSPFSEPFFFSTSSSLMEYSTEFVDDKNIISSTFYIIFFSAIFIVVLLFLIYVLKH